jgi:predicted O-methyltransferase YrrM
MKTGQMAGVATCPEWHAFDQSTIAPVPAADRMPARCYHSTHHDGARPDPASFGRTHNPGWRLMVDLEDEKETLRGSRHYHDVLSFLHRQLQPALYLEIGVRHGTSLALASGNAIAIDPQPELTSALPSRVRLFTTTSDDFFAVEADAAIDGAIDLAFIDGMHLFEFALRDFINIERHAKPGSIVVLDDIYPNHPIQASRDRQTKAWMGDIWKLRVCLERYRPDLKLMAFDTWPSGMLAVTRLDPNNRTLSDNCQKMIDEFVVGGDGTVPISILRRDDAVAPTDLNLSDLCSLARRLGGFEKTK